MPSDLFLPRLLRLAEENPRRVAVKLLRVDGRDAFREDPVSFDAWLRGARDVAGHLSRRGVHEGDRVLLTLPTSASFLHAFLGCLWMGAIPVPAPSLEGLARPSSYAARILGITRDARPVALLSDDKTAQALARELPDLGIPVLSPPWEPLLATDLPPVRAAADDLAFLQYTSGSTGTPKGVVVTHGNLMANVRAAGRGLAFGPDERMVSWLPLYHDMGLVGALLTPVCHLTTTHLLPAMEFLLRPRAWLSAMTRYRATMTVAPNFAYHLAANKIPDADLDGVDLSSIRSLVNGAEPVDPDTAHAFLTRFARHGLREGTYFPVYGLAEATLSVTFPPLGRPLVLDHVRRADLAKGQDVPAATGPGPGILSLVSVGKALDDHEIRIVDPSTGEALGERRLGEIVVSGPSVSPGYFGGELSAHRLRTGDLGYIAGGELFVVDRLKDLVLVAGRSYAPSDIERVAETVPHVLHGRTVAFSVPDSGTEALVLLAEVRAAAPLRAALMDEIRDAVLEETGLGAKEILLLKPSTLARTSSGKIMRSDARARYLAGTLELP
jgi:acyl-CoA synthetase (AMP-forming)/AMP-acid ligase II